MNLPPPAPPTEPPDLVPAEVAAVLAPHRRRADQLVLAALALHSLLAVVLAAATASWAGTLAVLATAWGVTAIGRAFAEQPLTRLRLDGVALALFVPWHLVQTGGVPEWAVFYFSTVAVLALGRDPVAVWPAAGLVVGWYVAWAADRLGLPRTAVHAAIAVAYAGACAAAAAKLRDRLVVDAAQYRRVKLLSLVAQQIRCGVVIGDEFARAVWVNEGFCQLTGYTADELIGRELSSMLGRRQPFRGPLTPDSFRTDKGSSGTRSAEIALGTKSGATVWVARSIAPLPTPDGTGGTSGGFVAIAIDINERKRAEAERSRLASILEATPDLVSISEPDGRIIYANPAAVRMAAGTRPPRPDNRSLQEFHPPWALKRLVEEGLPAASRDGVWAGETALLDGDGREIPTSQVVLAHKAADGRVEYFSTILRDIRDRKHAEAVLRERHRLATLSAEVALALNRPGPLAELLQECSDILWRHTEAAFVRVWTISPDTPGELVLRASAGLYTHIDGPHGRIPVGQYKIGRIAAEKRPVFTNSVVGDEQVHDQDWARREGMVAFAGHPLICGGELVGVLALFARKELSDEVRQALGVSADAIALGVARKRLEERMLQAQKLESLGVLAGGVAHDFNNLLTGVLGYASLMRDELDAGHKYAAFCEAIESAAKQAAGLCSQLLAYAGRGQMRVDAVDLNAAILGAADLIRPAVSRRLTPVYQLPYLLPLVRGDEVQIRQVALNLVTNASEAIGEANGSVTIATGHGRFDPADAAGDYLLPELAPGDYVWLDVADDGPGIDPAALPRIFEPFFTTKLTGRGLGLSAVLGIVRGHGGAIRVTTKPGAGCRFRVYFPREPGSTATPPPAPAETRPAEFRASGRVLVIDDEPAIRLVVGKLLESFGLTVDTAEDGRGGLAAFAAEPGKYRLVLVDLTMPDLDGDETARQLRACRPDVPVLLMSGYSEQELAERVANSGAAGFIRKPFRRDEVRDRVRRALGDD